MSGRELAMSSNLIVLKSIEVSFSRSPGYGLQTNLLFRGRDPDVDCSLFHGPLPQIDCARKVPEIKA
jgi:hypothetical protein